MIKKVVLFVTFFTILIRAQANFVPVWNEVYSFLDKMTVKGIINSNEFSKPLTRQEIAKHLKVIIDDSAKLNNVENSELEFYLKEFKIDLTPSTSAFNFAGKDYTSDLSGKSIDSAKSMVERWRLFSYNDTLFRIAIDPIFGLQANKKYNETQLWRYWGFNVYGNVTPNISFQVDFRDNWEKGDHLNKLHQFSTQEGPSIVVEKPNSIEYNMTNGALLYSNSWITFGGVKQTFNMGSGYKGQLVLSGKAPSFPAVYLKINPVSWMQFYYIHGWLLSRVIDSSARYLSQIAGKYKDIERSKYFAMHALQINPLKSLSFTLGETVIYSDIGPYMGYFIPFLFFRSVEHMYVGDRNGDVGNNGSMFFDVKYQPFNKLKLYGSLFVDEVSLTGILDGNSERNQTGYTAGFTAYDFGIPNLLARCEYTKIMPWVYSDWVQTQTYTNADYLMGHYIGQNSDQLFLQFEYTITRGLNVKLWGEMIRQGGMDSVKYQYLPGKKDFLYGKLRKEKNLGIDVLYEFMHDLFAKLSYVNSDVTDEDVKRTPSFMLGKNSSFGLSVYYGM